VASRVGVGTTFRFYFPREQDESYRDALPPGLEAHRGDETILLVEDDIQVRRLASRLLGQLGYRVIEASGAGEAMLAFHRYCIPIDLLFTDIVMPGMSGRQLSSMLHKTYPNLKILFMSGYNDEIAIGAEKAKGRRGFLAKPFSFDELSSKVREILDA
jgi:CheY-like chemotaxis protein